MIDAVVPLSMYGIHVALHRSQERFVLIPYDIRVGRTNACLRHH